MKTLTTRRKKYNNRNIIKTIGGTKQKQDNTRIKVLLR